MLNLDLLNQRTKDRIFIYNGEMCIVKGFHTLKGFEGIFAQIITVNKEFQYEPRTLLPVKMSWLEPTNMFLNVEREKVLELYLKNLKESNWKRI